MTEALLIGDGTVVSMHYKLVLDSGDVVDSSEGRDPLSYLHGANNIVPGLEKEMVGKMKGAKFDVDVAPADGYGERIDEAVQVVPRDMFPPEAELTEGLQFQATDPDGNPLMGTITAIADGKVTVDFNHVLAGQTLHFSIEVVDVRSATDEEKEHGHAHGAGGHAH